MDKKEYIERGELIQKIEEQRSFKDYVIQQPRIINLITGQDTTIESRKRCENEKTGLAIARNVALALPAADVVQIVRCKDCKYYEKINDAGKNGGEMWCCRCGALTRIRDDGESYCSFAERKDDEAS